MKPIQNSSQLKDRILGLLFDESDLLECYVAISYHRKSNGSKINSQLKKTWVYYLKFWRGAFNEAPIEVTYKHFRALEGRELDSLFLRSVLTEGSPYFFDKKSATVMKRMEVI